MVVVGGGGDLDAGEVRDTPGERDDGDEDADPHAVGQVVGEHGDGDGDGHDGGGAGRHPAQGVRVDAVPVERADRDHDHDADEGRHRDAPDDIAEADDEHEEERSGREGRQPRAGPS